MRLQAKPYLQSITAQERAPLSPNRQLAALNVMHQLVQQDSQFMPSRATFSTITRCGYSSC